MNSSFKQKTHKTCKECGTEYKLYRTTDRCPNGCKKAKGLKPMSEKRKDDAKIYSTLRKVFLENRPVCEASIRPLCTHEATDVHHKFRRGPNYLRVDTWMAVCRACHTYIENHPYESRTRGWLQ